MRAKTKTFLLLFNAIVLLRAESTLEKAVEYRKAEQFSQAERLLKKYSVPADFAGLSSSEKPEFLRGVLELAHVRALQDDVPGALRLLNWAEGRKDPYLRAIACVKYAEILLDLGEFERANAYLKNADEIICRRATEEETGAAIGQGGTTADTGAIWRDLGDDANALKAEIESEEMKKKFGATYGNYVKLRRLQNLVKRSGTPRYLKEAQKVADEIIETDPASQFAAAAGYLKGEILASRLKENSPKKEIKEVKDYLNRFVKQQPDGLYRGEALMLLGKISLEIEWNAKDAEKYYSQALAWFRKAREKRDALSLYAAMNDDLKKQSVPTQKPTTLNQWKRIVYHDEDPLKLYNTANAPVWYVDDKEKNCVYALGFLAFAEGKYDVAKSYWEKLPSLAPDIAEIDSRLPTVITRLLSSCKLKAMMFWPDEKKNIRDKNLQLVLQYAELLMILERFQDSVEAFRKIFYKYKNNEIKCLAKLGMGIATDIQLKKKDAKVQFEWVLHNKQLDKKSDIYGRALWEFGMSQMGIGRGYKEALPKFEEYVKRFPDGIFFRQADFYRLACYWHYGDLQRLEKEFSKFKARKDFEDVYTLELKERIEDLRQRKRKNKER